MLLVLRRKVRIDKRLDGTERRREKIDNSDRKMKQAKQKKRKKKTMYMYFFGLLPPAPCRKHGDGSCNAAYNNFGGSKARSAN